MCVCVPFSSIDADDCCSVHSNSKQNRLSWCVLSLTGGELFEQLSAKGYYRERDAANIMRTVLQVRSRIPLLLLAALASGTPALGLER